jgi:hypothetical protein
MQVWLVIALCSFLLFGAACGKHEDPAPSESVDEIQIQEIEGPGVEPHFDGPEILRGGNGVIEEGNDPTLDDSLK